MSMTPKRRSDLEDAPETLKGLSNEERKIAVRKAVFTLADVQSHVRAKGVESFNFATTTAASDLRNELRWNLKDLCNFTCCLERIHYRYSEWCSGSGPGATVIYPSDVYYMGFSKVNGKEWQQQNPWNYFKFSFSEKNDTIEIFSIHPERLKKS